MKEILPKPNKIGKRQKRKEWKKKREKLNKPKDWKRKERKRKVKRSDFLFALKLLLKIYIFYIKL